jgi:hypothetical protein
MKHELNECLYEIMCEMKVETGDVDCVLNSRWLNMTENAKNLFLDIIEYNSACIEHMGHVEDFIRNAVKDLGHRFHPDLSFSIKYDNDCHMFPDWEKMDEKMNLCKRICEDNGVDIYKLAHIIIAEEFPTIAH